MSGTEHSKSAGPSTDVIASKMESVSKEVTGLRADFKSLAEKLEAVIRHDAQLQSGENRMTEIGNRLSSQSKRIDEVVRNIADLRVEFAARGEKVGMLEWAFRGGAMLLGGLLVWFLQGGLSG